jgi:acylpyruvate hydrolase
MKLVTYSWNGQTALGALANDQIVDLRLAHRTAMCRGRGIDDSAKVEDRFPVDLLGLLQGGEASMAVARQALRSVENQHSEDHASGLCHSVTEVEFLAPIQRPGKIVCVGLNYRSHLAEIDETAPDYPILFHKVATSIIGHRQDIVLPRVSRQIDYEGELAVVIGRRGKYIPESNALAYVAGYTCANDVSAHDLEFRTSQWDSGKMLDTFCPLGPVLVTPDEISKPGTLRLRTIRNGKTVQDSYASDMVFPVPFLISYISSLTTLEPGDVILTGTPAGIGCNQDPQSFLQAGDRISVQIDGIGTLSNSVVAEEER